MFSSGCKVGPNYQRPALETPIDWKWKKAQVEAAAIEDHWWRMFNDARLVELETLALDANQDIKLAVARVDEARAIARINKADFFPQFSANPSVQRSKDSDNTFIPGGGSAKQLPHNRFSLPIDLSYEADVWGRVRRSVAAARDRAEASIADYQAVRLTVATDVAVNYFLLQALDGEIDVLENTLKLRGESLKLVESRLKFGQINPLDVSRTKSDLATNIAAIADTRRRRESVVHVIAILCGKPASEFTLEHKPIAIEPPEIPAGLPSSLLQRRPDVIRAERTLQARNEEIGVAKAAFFPRIALTASGGFESAELHTFFNWSSAVWQVAGNLAQPLFTGGRNKAQLEAAQARYDQSQAEYRQQVLVAFKDVEDALLDIRFRAEQAKAIAEAVESAREVTRIATTRYENGEVSNLEVVDAQRQQLEIEQQATLIQGQRLAATIRLIKALGGGWSGDVTTLREVPAEPPQPD
jgi:outer membrane protein, multidrug efflux system